MFFGIEYEERILHFHTGSKFRDRILVAVTRFIEHRPALDGLFFLVDPHLGS